MCRPRIVRDFASWTARAALGRAPVRDGETLYPALDRVPFDELFDTSAGPIPEPDFARWHEAAVEGLRSDVPGLPVGWAAKLVNVYLKTSSYVGDLGRPGLRDLLHPPIDGGLWAGLRRWAVKPGSPERGEILARTHAVESIAAIQDYEAHYEVIIEGCRDVARIVGCRLIEVEQFWEGVRRGQPPVNSNTANDFR